MTLEKTPFQRYGLDDDPNYKKQDVVTIRINANEREILNEFKRLFDVKSDGKMVKMGFIIGTNVLQRDFPPKILRYLMKGDRVKLSDYKDIDE
tara:strand:+ start:45 stop:323 length:279 start_codon:yes stop_codon:yes gene_type:complete